MDSSRRAGLIYIVISVTAYSMFSIWVKALQTSGMPSLDIGLWRFGLAVPLIWAVIAFTRRSTQPVNQPAWQPILMGLLLASNALLAFFGLERIPVSLFIMLFYTYPAMVALVSLAMGERLGDGGTAAADRLGGAGLDLSRGGADPGSTGAR